MEDIGGVFFEVGRRYKHVFISILAGITCIVILVVLFIIIFEVGSMSVPPGVGGPDTQGHGVVSIAAFTAITAIMLLGIRTSMTTLRAGKRLEMPDLQRFGLHSVVTQGILAATSALAACEVLLLDPTLVKGFLGIAIMKESTMLMVSISPGFVLAALINLKATFILRNYLDYDKPERMRTYGTLAINSLVAVSIFALLFAVVLLLANFLQKTSFDSFIDMVFIMVTVVFGMLIAVFSSRSAFLFARAFQSINQMQRFVNT